MTTPPRRRFHSDKKIANRNISNSSAREPCYAKDSEKFIHSGRRKDMVTQFNRGQQHDNKSGKQVMQKKNVPDSRACLISPRQFKAVLFDMDGIVTKTATLHARAWKKSFDEFLKKQSSDFKPFDIRSDYQ